MRGGCIRRLTKSLFNKFWLAKVDSSPYKLASQMSTARITRSFFWNRNCSGNFVKLSELEVWNKIGGSPYSFRSNDNLYIRNNSFKNQQHNKFFNERMLLTRSDDCFFFSAFLHWELVFIFSRERKLLPILEKGEMIVLHTRSRKNGDLHLWEAPFCFDARTRRH